MQLGGSLPSTLLHEFGLFLMISAGDTKHNVHCGLEKTETEHLGGPGHGPQPSILQQAYDDAMVPR